jgi:hypothetical protein
MSSTKRASPTFGTGGLHAHIHSLSGREIELGRGIPSSASFTKLVVEESRSARTASDAESLPKTGQKEVNLEHGWPEKWNICSIWEKLLLQLILLAM